MPVIRLPVLCTTVLRSVITSKRVLAFALLAPLTGNAAFFHTLATGVAENRGDVVPYQEIHDSLSIGSAVLLGTDPARLYSAQANSKAVSRPGGVELYSAATFGTLNDLTPGLNTPFADARAQATLVDSFAITAVGASGSTLAGQHGTITVALRISGSTSSVVLSSADPPASVCGCSSGGALGVSDWDASLALGSFAPTGQEVSVANFAGSQKVRTDSRDGTITSGDLTPFTPFGTYPLSLGVVFGGNIGFTLQGSEVAQSYYSNNTVAHLASGSSVVDLFHTLAWGGIVDVRDSQGQEVGSFTALSPDTGFNYAHAFSVPEPASYILFGVGLATLGLMRKRRLISLFAIG